MTPDRFDAWVLALEHRHLSDLTFPEVSRALRALSSTYVERRSRIGEGAALSGAGKRAAFALFYGPLHFLLVHHIALSIPGAAHIEGSIVDLGCGTGAAGAAWASVCPKPPAVIGIDRHPWAREESARTYDAFRLRARSRTEDVARAALPGGSHVVAAFVLNEMERTPREMLLTRLVEHARTGGHVLVVEPLAKAVAPWWRPWAEIVEAAGGRADEWRVAVQLPPIVEKLDRAAGLRHREITGRSLWL